jgi:sugar phosphate isomerase/epimerase
MLKDNFSIQLYSVRREIEREGFPAVLEKLAGIGYTGVEFAGYGGLSAAEMLSLLQQNGLKPVSAHIGLERLETAFDEEAAYHKTLGTPMLIVPSAPFGNAEEVRQTAARLSALAKRVGDAGFGFAFHNHDAEFALDGGQTRIETMMALAPDVELQLDVYWASRAGCDCAAFIRKHARRLVSLHIKQLDAQGGDTDLGDGILDFGTLINAGLEAGVKSFVHEQEAFSGDPFASLRNGFQHIMSL